MAGKTYKQLKTELDTLLRWFEQEEFDIDEALEKYKKVAALIKEIEKLLAAADLEIKKLH